MRDELAATVDDYSVGYFVKGQKRAILKGSKYQYFDLASLTKVVFTATALGHLLEQDSRLLQRSVQSILPWWPESQTQLIDLATHTSGLVWWEPLYKTIPLTWLPNERLLFVAEQLKLRGDQLRRTEQPVYSDLGVLLLGLCMERLWNSSLTGIARQLKLLEHPNLCFHRDNLPLVSKLKVYAPTEQCPWRKKLIQGQVHDENAWALGGIAPHAGLFGTIEGLLQWHQQFLNFSPRVVHTLTKRHRADFGVLFMKPSLSGLPSCGSSFSKDSYGHLGFTGTSFWHDPKDSKTVVILTNAVYPQRQKPSPMVRLRPLIHDWLVREY